MVRRSPFRIEYAPEVERHLRALTKRDIGVVMDAVDRQLTHEPLVETRNRKPLRPNPLAPWELRVGHLRVYFNVDDGPARVVSIVAVGVKVRNRVVIAGEEVDLGENRQDQ